MCMVGRARIALLFDFPSSPSTRVYVWTLKRSCAFSWWTDLVFSMSISTCLSLYKCLALATAVVGVWGSTSNLGVLPLVLDRAVHCNPPLGAFRTLLPPS